jgi:hypothetical protein
MFAVAATVSAAAVWTASPALVASQGAQSAFPTSGFSDGVFIPVREIQRPTSQVVSLTSTPRHAFARVRCAGKAHRTSDCWVLRP